MHRLPPLTRLSMWACAAILTACGGGDGSQTATSSSATPSSTAETAVVTGAATTPTSTATTSPSPTTSSTSTADTATPVTLTQGFYLNPYMQARQFVLNNGADGRAAVIRDQIASRPTGVWFGGWETDVTKEVRGHVDAAQTAGTLPILVAYNIPNKGCNGSGAASADAYRTWIAGFADGIAQRPAIVILEPDALAQLDDCKFNDAQRTERLGLLAQAVATLTARATRTWVYVDAGNAGWLTADTAASRLLQSGIQQAHGFALNVSNYIATSTSTTYGQQVNSRLQSLGGLSRPFVVDTGRNGNGAGSTWCDPAGRRIGELSQYKGQGAEPEMTLWVKPPGESDGCAYGTSAGGFDPELAYRLATGT